MTATSTRPLDPAAVVRAVDQLVDLVSAAGPTWEAESALPGLTVGGLTRHLVSQPECAVEFLAIPPQEHAEVLALDDYFARVDWLHADVGAPENTSIRDDFNAMAAAGHAESVAVLAASRDALGASIAAAGPTTYVPWQDCALATDDFLVVRLMEVVVHADDLAVSLGLPTPRFEPAVLDPVLALLALLSARRHGQDAVLRALARAERASGQVSAF